jgi:PAS domain S-box-containing protein
MGMTGDRSTSQELQKTLAELTQFSLQAGIPEEFRKAIRALELSQVELERHNRELQDTQKLLEDSRCRYADLFDNAPVGYVTLDEQGRILSANSTAARMLGRDLSQISGSFFGTFARDEQAFQRHMERCRTEPGKVTSEAWLVTSSTTCFPVEIVTEKAIRPGSQDGEMEYRTTLTDLSELKKAQDDLDKMRLLLTQAMESAKLSVWSRDLKTGVVRMWSSLPLMLEREGGEWHGTVEETYATLHPDDMERVRQVIEESIANGSDFRLEMRVRNSDGSYAWSESRGHIRCDTRGVPQVLEGISLRIDELKRSKELLQDVARFPGENPSPVLRCRQDGTLLYSNAAAETLLKQIGNSTGDPLPPSFLPWVQKAFASGLNQMLSVRVGAQEYSFQVVPIRDLSYVNLYGREVTDQRKAEEIVQRQADLIELSPDAMFVRTLDGHVTFWSKGAERLYGYTKEEALGKTSRELLGTTLPEPFETIIAKLRNGERWTGELIHRRRDGATLTVQSRWLLRPGGGEYPDEIFESNVDITERKRMEEDIRHSEERFRMLIETSNEPVAILDDERRFASISQAGADILGWGRAILGGKDSGALIPSDERPMFEKAIDEFQQSAEQNLAILMTRFTRQDGSRRWIEWELSPIRAHGRPSGFLVRLRDLGAYLPMGSGYHKGPSDQ